MFFVPMHAIAFLAGPFTFTWDALAVAVALYVVTGGLGLSLSYHRQVSTPFEFNGGQVSKFYLPPLAPACVA